MSNYMQLPRCPPSQAPPHPIQPTPTTDIPQDGDSSGQASAEGDDEFELRSGEETEVSSDSFDPDDYRDAPGEGARGSSPAGRLQGSCPEGSHPPPAYTPPPPAARGTPATASETGIPRHSGSSNVASSPRPVSTAAVAAEPPHIFTGCLEPPTRRGPHMPPPHWYVWGDMRYALDFGDQNQPGHVADTARLKAAARVLERS